ncbi:M1-specific T cell receptor beta chain [Brachyhypopomus gauderio]|uniref:M1-specific T cell receptor beta chain n=1 Tax=Brachyhypopomus gauderio TaxID=698409 RepID=UPI00404366BB
MFSAGLLLWLLLETSSAQQVLQSPASMVAFPAKKVALHCSMASGFSVASYTMLYRHVHYGAPVEFLIQEFDEPKGSLSAVLDIDDNTFSLHLSDLQLQDSVTYYCAAREKEKAESSVGITVSQDPLLFLKYRGDVVNMECKHDDKTYYYMYWYRQRTLGELDLVAMSAVSVWGVLSLLLYSVNNQPAYFGQGTKLTVLDPLVNITKPTVKILKPSENEECEKTRVTLVCLATGFYPDHVQMSWRINGMKQMNGVATDNAASYSNKTGEMPFYTISSRLSITHQEWHDGLHYKCVVSFYNGKETSIHSDSINGPQGPKGKICH